MARQSTSPEQAVSQYDADGLAIEVAIAAFFRALASEDHQALAAVVDREFCAFDGGEQMDLDQLRALVATAILAGKTFDWRITALASDRAGDLAWARWRNVGGVREAGVLTPMSWLESANLRRGPDGWRLTFLHSTRERQAAPMPAMEQRRRPKIGTESA